MSGLKILVNVKDESNCPDLTLKKSFVLVYFCVCDPGHEYEIFLEKDIEDTPWCAVQRGRTVTVKLGAARTQGVVVEVSEDLKYLQTNLVEIIKMHQGSIQNGQKKMNTKMEYVLHRNSCGYIDFKNSPITCDKETQTDELSVSSDSEDVDYRTKYEEAMLKYEKIFSVVSDLKHNMENSLPKLSNITRNVNLATSPSSCSSSDENKENAIDFGKMVQIGSKGTTIPQYVFDNINWTSYTAATRKLLVTLFQRKVLATHSLTGKPSPAFLTVEKETKARLNPNIISDIVELVSKKCKVTESLVRSSITTKCADENKLYKRRLEKGEEENEIFGKKKRC